MFVRVVPIVLKLSNVKGYVYPVMVTKITWLVQFRQLILTAKFSVTNFIISRCRMGSRIPFVSLHAEYTKLVTSYRRTKRGITKLFGGCLQCVAKLLCAMIWYYMRSNLYSDTWSAFGEAHRGMQPHKEKEELLSLWQWLEKSYADHEFMNEFDRDPFCSTTWAAPLGRTVGI